MAQSPQQDLFGAEAPAELFDPDAAPPAYRPDPDQVRARLHRIRPKHARRRSFLGIRTRLLVYRTIFPQMAGWLPEEEAAQLKFEFDAELVRLKAA